MWNEARRIAQPASAAYRLGVPVKLLGAPLRSHDSRRWQNGPHLSVSLAYLRDIFEYLHAQNIRFYRLAGQLAPYVTHPTLLNFHRQIEECSTELAALGDIARLYRLRLTLHLAHFVQLSSPDPARAARARQELSVAARLLDTMGLGPEAVIIVHVGGAYGDGAASLVRFVRNVEQLDRTAAARLALENDDRHFGLQDVLWVQRRTGLRIVLDTLHHCCLNPSGHPLTNALALALATWPAAERPKIHVSTSRTTLRTVIRNGQRYVQAPLPNQHSDFVDPFVLIDLLRGAQRANLRPFDIMVEAKAKDLAVLRLREQVARFAPELAGMVA